MVVQTAISNVDRLTNLGFHPDLVQWHEPYTDNRIVYGLTADTNIQAQGIGSGETVSNIAIINTRLNNTGYGGAIFSFAGPTTHLIVRNSKFYGSSFWRTDKGFVPTSVLIDNSQFYNGSTNLLPKVYGPAVGDGITVR
jgi:hypothetical protein